jgi:imidazolonepropionase-like amidohydrolase
MAGFTTVRDCGAADKLNLALRDAVAKGWIVGPRVVAAGGVTTTGGHDDPTNGLASFLEELIEPSSPTRNSRRWCRRRATTA